MVDSLTELSVRVLENFDPGAGMTPLETMEQLKIMFTTFTEADVPEEERKASEAVLVGAEFVEAILKVDASALERFVKEVPPLELIGALLRFNRQLCLLGCSSTEMSRVQYLGFLLQIQAGKALEGVTEEEPSQQD